MKAVALAARVAACLLAIVGHAGMAQGSVLQAGPISGVAGRSAVRLAVAAADVSPLAPPELDLRRPALLSDLRRSAAQVEWISEDVIRWWEQGVESGAVSSETASLRVAAPLRRGALALETRRAWSYGDYAAQRAGAVAFPETALSAAYGARVGRSVKLGVRAARSEGRGDAAGTYLGGLLNDAPSGTVEFPLTTRAVALEARGESARAEVALRLEWSDASWPVTLANAGDVVSADLGHRGLGWGVEAFQQLNERTRLCAFGGSADRSGEGAIRYRGSRYGQAQAGFYDQWLGIGAEWRAGRRTTLWGEVASRAAAMSVAGATAIPGPLGIALPGEKFHLQGGARLEANSVRASVRHQRRDGICLLAGAQVARLDAGAHWQSLRTHLWAVAPPDASASSAVLNDVHLYIVGVGAHKEYGDTSVSLAVSLATATARRAPPEPVPPPEPPLPRPERAVRGGLTVAAALTHCW